jgi:hypothetical protein
VVADQRNSQYKLADDDGEIRMAIFGRFAPLASMPHACGPRFPNGRKYCLCSLATSQMAETFATFMSQ